MKRFTRQTAAALLAGSLMALPGVLLQPTLALANSTEVLDKLDASEAEAKQQEWSTPFDKQPTDIPAAKGSEAPGQSTAGQLSFTLEAAVDKAYENSLDYKQAELDLNRSWEVRDDAKDYIDYTPTRPNATEATTFNKLLNADLNWQMSKKNLKIQKDTIEVSITTKYMDLLRAQETVAYANKAKEAADWKLRATRAGFYVGTVSQPQLVDAEATAATAQASVDSAKKQLDDAYNKFNIALGLNAGDRPVLTEKINYSPLVVESLEHEVSRVIAESPTIFKAEYNVDLASFNREAASPYNVGQIDIEKAKLAVGQLKDGTEKSVRSLYYNIKTLEEQHNGLVEALRNAQTNYQATKVRFDVGMITQADLVAAESQLAKAQKDLLDNEAQHTALAVTFQKPWGASAS
ncbi:TolC family protein [Heliobacillus mobilis]|uniref:TolC family protein n=1 Tax=Heliobacterium mobile TaxID=28064 RepID=A0A6I3SLF4_HELMO|nr:TolC family protein [Heliobacterium mobile]MTV49606.1 TolC family protein [Heliobacterium mobile]